MCNDLLVLQLNHHEVYYLHGLTENQITIENKRAKIADHFIMN